MDFLHVSFSNSADNCTEILMRVVPVTSGELLLVSWLFICCLGMARAIVPKKAGDDDVGDRPLRIIFYAIIMMAVLWVASAAFGVWGFGLVCVLILYRIQKVRSLDDSRRAVERALLDNGITEDVSDEDIERAAKLHKRLK